MEELPAAIPFISFLKRSLIILLAVCASILSSIRRTRGILRVSKRDLKQMWKAILLRVTANGETRAQLQVWLYTMLCQYRPLLYDSEAWALQNKNENKINVVEMCSLRRICGVSLADSCNQVLARISLLLVEGQVNSVGIPGQHV